MNGYALFAQILDYPGPGLAGVLEEGIAESQPANPETARLLARFKGECERLGLPRLEELYTNTFDLRADCSLYAGYHLFGEDWRRSLFLAELKERYRACGFSCGIEMPDHMAVLLRFLSVQTDPGEETVVIEDCVRPVVSRVAAQLDPALHPYRGALEALRLWLGRQDGRGPARDETGPQSEEVAR